MGTYLLRRLFLLIPTVIGMTFLIFMLIASSKGGIGAAIAFSSGAGQAKGESAALQRARLEDRYGLDSPVVVQYGRWIGRVSPVKFGTRDQVSPAGERFREPRSMKDPPLWEWFVDALPEPDAPKELPGKDAEEQVKRDAYRQASNDFAAARVDHVRARTEFELAAGTLLRETGHRDAVESDGTVILGLAKRIEPDKSHALWADVEQKAKVMLDTYKATISNKATLDASFATKPFPESGWGLIPGVLWLDAPDLGYSYSRSTPVINEIAKALPYTLMLNLAAFPIIYLIAVPSGILSATHRGSWIDVTSGSLFVALWSIPVVWAGVLAIGFLANDKYLGMFPVSGLHDNDAANYLMLPSWGENGFERGYLLDTLWHLCLPVACIVYGGFAILSKQTRAAMLENFTMDYVRTAKAKGVDGGSIVMRHVFRNSLLPIITMFVTVFPATLAGSVVIERIFSIPGMGSMIIDAIFLRDTEILLSNSLIIGIVNVVALLLADILYAMADPRITYK
ncbi:MAG: ABC transporter permease [Phycisphaeraceae bacterium]|nr:ABC transporter permease [Phycisphaeraceae bacterium]